MYPKISLALLTLVGPVLLLSCGKPKAQVDASVPLQQSFTSAEPEVQQAIQTATTSLKSGNYADATRALAPVVSGRKLNEEQRQAVGLALKQVNDAISANPKLDTKEMYELRAKMFRAVDGGSRF
jgi:hypothetical protein